MDRPSTSPECGGVLVPDGTRHCFVEERGLWDELASVVWGQGTGVVSPLDHQSRMRVLLMKLVSNEHGVISIELTRRNLVALIQKLDAQRDGIPTACTLAKCGESETNGLILRVKAVEDEEHYSDRLTGLMMNPSTGEVW